MTKPARSIGAYEAKTHLSEILEEVERGYRIAVTKRGRPVAMIVPIEPDAAPTVADVLKELDAIRKTVRGGGSIRSMMQAGRRR